MRRSIYLLKKVLHHYHRCRYYRYHHYDYHCIDVSRTFPEHPYFDTGKGVDSLRTVLQCYACHNPNVGYCQSLNFLVGMMLLFMNEEDSFWLLATVLEKLLPSDYYTKSMIGIYVDQYVLGHMIKLYLPEVHKKLEEFELQLPIITVQWFLCLFINTLRPEVGLRIWDMFLNEGNKVLFRISMALFKSAQREILSAKDPGDLFVVLRNIGTNIVDVDSLIALAYKTYTHPKFDKIYLQPSSSKRKTKIRSDSSIGLPFDLTGLGLAHVGPTLAVVVNKNIGALSTESTPNSTNDTTESPSTITSSNKSLSVSSEAVTHEEEKTLYYTYKCPDPYPSNVQTQMKIERHDNKVNRRRSSSFLSQRLDYRSFKIKDIENWRQEFLPALQLKFEMMEAARSSFREREEESRSSLEKLPSLNDENEK